MTHRSRLAGFIIDCRTDDLEGAAAFWRAALGDDEVRAPEGAYVVLADQGGLAAAVQKVDHPSRVHLDIETDDAAAEVARLEKLGARKVAAVKTWVVMEAPTGHRFCVCQASTRDFTERANTWEDDA
jgi:hypothetical protein